MGVNPIIMEQTLLRLKPIFAKKAVDPGELRLAVGHDEVPRKAILVACDAIDWWAQRCLIVVLLALGITQARGQPVAEPQSPTEVFYSSGPLRIQAYLYRPPGNGPFPLVIYNHGSRENRERESWPFSYVGRILLQSGYAVLVPERRGYGRSDGLTFSEEMRWSIGRRGAAAESPHFVDRLQAESDDVLAALDFIRTLPFVDQRRLGVMGWSFGGIVTMFAVSRSAAFRAVVDQAGGALVWDGSAALREALLAAARQVRSPVLLMVAQNDRTTASITTLANALQVQNPATELIIYPPFTPSRNFRNIAPGHLIFSEQGSAIWENDVRRFFARYLGDNTSPALR
jgi:dienelactone hydrolase